MNGPLIPFLNNKILDQSKFKAFADDIKSDPNSKICSGLDRKHCWLPAFSFFTQCFQKALSFGSLKDPEKKETF